MEATLAGVVTGAGCVNITLEVKVGPRSFYGKDVCVCGKGEENS